MEDKDLICPICTGLVSGNEKDKYYCKKCNILLSERDLKIKPSDS